MHLQTHILSGWCAANVLPLTARQRLCCMLAAALPDLDGLSIIFGQEAFWDYHHVLGHNLPFGLVTSVALAAWSRRAATFGLYLALFHLHLLMDYYGSGPGWGIAYLWPFSATQAISPHAWAFYSWQNLSTAGALVLWTLWLVRAKGRTPLEALMPALDRQLVDLVQRRRPARTSPPAPSSRIPPSGAS